MSPSPPERDRRADELAWRRSRLSRSSKSAIRSLAQLVWMSPASTTGLAILPLVEELEQPAAIHFVARPLVHAVARPLRPPCDRRGPSSPAGPARSTRPAESPGRRCSHFSCSSPSSVPRGSSASAHGGLLPSPQGWSVRYCRVSSTKNSASRPNATPPIELHVRPLRQRAPPQRHVLVIGLVGARPACRKSAAVTSCLFRDVAGAVVVELVIVPGDEPRERGMGRLQVRRRSCTGRGGCGSRRANRSPCRRACGLALLAGRPFVDVVAQVDDQVEIVLGHVLVGGEQPDLEVLARGEREPQPLRRRFGRRRSAGAADGAGLARGVEPVPVPAVGLQPVDFDVDRVRPVGRGDGRALGGRPSQSARPRPLPRRPRPSPPACRRLPAAREPAASRARRRRRRIARGDAERKRVVLELHETPHRPRRAI